MSITYKRCDEPVLKMAKELMAEFESHAGVVAAKVKIDFIFAFAPRDADGFPVGRPLKLHGNTAAGICRILPLKQRSIGRGDAEISLDGDWWVEASREQRRSLLDHEIHHLIVRLNQGIVLRDDLGRPLLRMRKHDVDVGWFAVIAERHGEASFEVSQAQDIKRAFGQFLWPEIAEGKAVAA